MHLRLTLILLASLSLSSCFFSEPTDLSVANISGDVEKVVTDVWFDSTWKHQYLEKFNSSGYYTEYTESGYGEDGNYQTVVGKFERGRNNKALSVNYYKDGKQIGRHKLRYNLKGRVRKVMEYDTLDNPSSNIAVGLQHHYKYNKAGLRESMHTTHYWEELGIEEYEYDDAGNEILCRYSRNDTLLRETTKTYDKNGNMTSFTTKYANPDRPPVKRTFSHEFDDKGNWIKMVCTGEEGRVLFRKERKI